MKFKMNYKLILGFSLLILIIGCNNSQKKNNYTPLKEFTTHNPQVIVHYMGWYGDSASITDASRHWKHGHANTPIIGRYNSKNKATLVYHTLLAWAAGIDAIAINVKDKYDQETMLRLFNVIDEIQSIAGKKFSLKYLISYDDQGFDLTEPLDTTLTKMNEFKENLMIRQNYLYHKEHPLFFSFDYPKKFLTAKSFRTTIDAIFQTNKPYLIWNTFGEGESVEEYVDAFYPWVQPGGEWDVNGLNWGDDYLKYFYTKVNKFNKEYDFICAGVWAGFDDRKNTSWGGNRIISRQDGKVYDNTWNYIHSYKGKLPIKYVVIETWNDWNEGTEIEPSIEHGFQYLIQTTKHINKIKGTKLSEDGFRFEVAKKIHNEIQKNDDKITNNTKRIIKLFCSQKFEEANNSLEK